MHKYLLSFLLLILLNPVISKAQFIGQIKIQYANPGVNNNLDVIAEVTIPSQPAFRINNSSRISNDTIYLMACYYSGMAATPKLIKDTISIGSPPPGINTLHFKIFTSFSTSHCIQDGSAVKTQAFIIRGPLGIKPNAIKTEFVLHPNPTIDFLILKEEAIQSATIRDLTGKIIRTVHFQNVAGNKVDVREFSTGIYLLETVSKDGSIQIQRFLKK